MATVVADYANLAIKGLKEPFKLALEKNLEQYRNQPFVKFYNTNEWSEIFSSTEGISGVRELADEETPDVVSLDEGYNMTITPVRKGVGMVITQTTMVRAGDDTTKIDTYLMEQRNQLLKSVSNDVLVDAFYAYNNAFNSSATTLAPDGAELCGTHTYNGGGTFANKTTAQFSETAWDAVELYAGRFTDPTDTTKPMPLNFTAILVKKGSAVAKLAKQLFATGVTPTAWGDVNVYAGSVKVVETPYISYTNRKYWFAIDESIETPVVLGMVKTPTFEDPITLENQSIRTNVIGYWKKGIVKMPIGVYGGDGTV
jgi:hypothetical protein